MGSFHVKSTNASSSTISDFDKIFPECALMYQNMLCKILQQYSQYSFFGRILKTSGVTPFIAICKSRLNLLSYSASHNSTIIVDKFMNFAGDLVMVVLIMGCGKNLISEQ